MRRIAFVLCCALLAGCSGSGKKRKVTEKLELSFSGTPEKPEKGKIATSLSITITH